MARVVLSFDAWKEGRVAPATVAVPMIIPKVVNSPQLRATLKWLGDNSGEILLSSDGKTLAVGNSARGEVKLWDLGARKERATLVNKLGKAGRLALSPDGRTLAVGVSQFEREKGGWTGGIELWDAKTGRSSGVLQHAKPRGVFALAYSPDGKTLAALEIGQDGKENRQNVTLWDVAEARVRASLPEERGHCLAWSPDGKVLARGVYLFKGREVTGTEVRLWDVSAGKERPALTNPGSKNPLRSLAWSPDGRTLAGTDYTGAITLWDVDQGRVRATLPSEGERVVLALAFAPDGKTLAAAVGNRSSRSYEPGLIALWDAGTGRRLDTLTGHRSDVFAVAYYPDGRTLVSGGRDGTVRLWDVSERSAKRPPADN